MIVLAAIGSSLSKGNGSKSPTVSPANGAATTPVNPAAPTNSSSPTSNLTPAEQQAIESARNYLSMRSGFSRAGLIKQLSSAYGEGFSRKVATFAVDHLHVNWDQQAVESAKNYMKLGSGFSRAGLINQLQSSYGDGFTHSQAVYAANAVGL